MWGSLLIVAVKLTTYFLGKSEVDKKIKENFFAWVKQAGEDIGSTKLMEYGDRHKKFFEENPFVETK